MNTPTADDVRRAVLRDGIKGRDEEIARMKDDGIPQAALTQALREIRRLEVALVAEQVRAEADLRDARMLCNGSCDIALARRQVGPDGDVPGNARECAELWEREASRLRSENRSATARAERAEADAATLRAFVQEMADRKVCLDEPAQCISDSGPYCQTHGFDHGYSECDITKARKVLAALTSGGQG